MLSFIPFLLCSLPLISAHFTLDFPTARGFIGALEPQFCGGFFNVSAVRSPFPLGYAPISINSHHVSADVAIQISFESNPTSFNQFNQTSNGTGYGDLMKFGTVNGAGEWCFHVDVSKLNVAGVGNGTLATIQVIYNGGDAPLFQCANIILSSTYTASNYTCANVTKVVTPSNTTSTAVNATAAVTAAGSAASATSTTKGSGAVKNAGVVGGIAGLMMLGLVGLIV